MSTQPDPAQPEPPPAGSRTAGLQRSAQARTQRAEKAANDAIRDLVKRGATINFTAVARVAGVTPAFLHRHPDLSARIRELSDRQRSAVYDQHVTTATGESAVIAVLRRKLHDQETAHAAQVKELRGRIAELERQVAALYGRLG